MGQVYKGNTEYFKNIGKIPFEGKDSDNPLAFKFYDENRKVLGKTMKDHLRFGVAYWHSFCANGGDPFGNQTIFHPWDHADPMTKAQNKADAAFEFISKLGAPYYCFHDVDVSPEGSSLSEYETNLQKVTVMLKERQDASGIRLLWNTANAFSNPRYMNGAATNPDFNVLAYAAAQSKGVSRCECDTGRGRLHILGGARRIYVSL